MHWVVKYPCTFAELDRRIEDSGLEARGDNVIYLKKGLNIVLWSDMSDAYSAAVLYLKKIGAIDWRSATVLEYMMDGRVMQLPVAVRPPANGYKSEHWIPVVLKQAEHEKDIG